MQKIAEFLKNTRNTITLEHSVLKTYGLEEDNAINIYLSREDLASLSNMTTSNAIRTLGNFVTEKVITLDGRKIKILDEERLRKISKLG